MGGQQETDAWIKAYRSYAGWVPNVRSHLSFSMIGAAKRAESFTEPLRKRPTRIVLVHQHRTVNDYPLAEWLAKIIAPDISLHWMLDAETAATDIPVIRDGKPHPEKDRQGMLRGTIRLWARMDSEKAKAAQKVAIREIDRLLRTPCMNPASECSREAADATIDGLRSDVRYHIDQAGPAIILDFALMRTGECRVWYGQKPSNVEEDLLDWVAEQGYYFIKDVVHDHTHHDETSDQITPLYRFGKKLNEPGHDDEIAWRRETLWSLSREIERLNREGGLTDQRKSLGIIAYAEAFQASLMGHTRTQDSKDRFQESTSVHDYDFKHLKDSIRASIDVNSTRLAQKIQVAIALPTMFIASTALVSSLVSTHNGALAKVKEGLAPGTIGLGGLDGWVPTLASNPALTGFSVMVALLVVIAYFLLDGRAGVYNRTQRWFSQLGRALAVTFFDSLLLHWLFMLVYHIILIGLTLLATFYCFNLVLNGGAL